MNTYCILPSSLVKVALSTITPLLQHSPTYDQERLYNLRLVFLFGKWISLNGHFFNDNVIDESLHQLKSQNIRCLTVEKGNFVQYLVIDNAVQ
jgi:hypothetical protein